MHIAPYPVGAEKTETTVAIGDNPDPLAKAGQIVPDRNEGVRLNCFHCLDIVSGRRIAANTSAA